MDIKRPAKRSHIGKVSVCQPLPRRKKQKNNNDAEQIQSKGKDLVSWGLAQIFAMSPSASR
jgi:hypothetical protein